MKRLTYVELRPMSRDAIRAALASDPATYAAALVSAALFDETAFVEELVLMASSNPDAIVRGAAMISICHIARLHRDVDSMRRMLPLIEKGIVDHDYEVRGKAGDALDDVDVFVPSLRKQTGRIRAMAPTSR